MARARCVRRRRDAARPLRDSLKSLEASNAQAQREAIARQRNALSGRARTAR